MSDVQFTAFEVSTEKFKRDFREKPPIIAGVDAVRLSDHSTLDLGAKLISWTVMERMIALAASYAL